MEKTAASLRGSSGSITPPLSTLRPTVSTRKKVPACMSLQHIIRCQKRPTHVSKETCTCVKRKRSLRVCHCSTLLATHLINQYILLATHQQHISNTLATHPSVSTRKKVPGVSLCVCMSSCVRVLRVFKVLGSIYVRLVSACVSVCARVCQCVRVCVCVCMHVVGRYR